MNVEAFMYGPSGILTIIKRGGLFGLAESAAI